MVLQYDKRLQRIDFAGKVDKELRKLDKVLYSTQRFQLFLHQHLEPTTTDLKLRLVASPAKTYFLIIIDYRSNRIENTIQELADHPDILRNSKHQKMSQFREAQ